MKQDKSRHHFWTGWKCIVTPCSWSDNRSRKRWPDCLLLPSLKQSFRVPNCVQWPHSGSQSLLYWRNIGGIFPLEEIQCDLVWWTPECGGSQAKKSILQHLIYDVCLVLYPVRLGGGDWHRASKQMMLGHPIVLPSGKPTCNLKLLQASLACIEQWFAGDTTYMSLVREKQFGHFLVFVSYSLLSRECLMRKAAWPRTDTFGGKISL